VQTVRAAAERVKSRRASVPQPWLGARGDAVAGSPLEFFVSRGWPRDQAGELLRRRQGVVLTAVVPGTPAARAGLRPGDVVSRIDNFDVRGVEDMSQLLKETGDNLLADFRVHRAHESPRSLRVRLSESQNPALETARAEASAAEAAAEAAEAAVRRLDDEVRRVDEMIAALDESVSKPQAGRGTSPVASAAGRDEALKELDGYRRRLTELQSRLNDAESHFVRARAQVEEAVSRLAAAADAQSRMAAGPLLPFGVEAMPFETVTVVNGITSAKRGLIVAAARPGSPAALSGVRAGDLIESVDDARLGPDWQLRRHAPPLAQVKLGLLRDGKSLTVVVKRAPRT
jgi:C-terminal processing protease CtpA/Prc